MSRVENRLTELNLTLPQAAKPVAAYIPATRVGNLVMTSGQLPTVNGALEHVGRVGTRFLSIEVAQVQARHACLNALAAIKQVIGNLDQITRVVRLVVYVQSEENFHAQSQVANGASELLIEIFGERGKHIRSAIGTNALPLNAPLELELTVEVE